MWTYKHSAVARKPSFYKFKLESKHWKPLGLISKKLSFKLLAHVVLSLNRCTFCIGNVFCSLLRGKSIIFGEKWPDCWWWSQYGGQAKNLKSDRSNSHIWRVGSSYWVDEPPLFVYVKGYKMSNPDYCVVTISQFRRIGSLSYVDCGDVRNVLFVVVKFYGSLVCQSLKNEVPWTPYLMVQRVWIVFILSIWSFALEDEVHWFWFGWEDFLGHHRLSYEEWMNCLCLTIVVQNIQA